MLGILVNRLFEEELILLLGGVVFWCEFLFVENSMTIALLIELLV